MAGPVIGGEQKVSWAARPPSPAFVGQPIPEEEPTAESSRTPGPLLSPSEQKFVDESPAALDNSGPILEGNVERRYVSAPAIMGKPHQRFIVGKLPVKYSLDYVIGDWAPPSPNSTASSEAASISQVWEQGDAMLDIEGEKGMAAEPSGKGKGKGKERSLAVQEPEDGWGEPFKVEWICVDRVPFRRTRHLRNPWNNDREVKVSRDGTELEPTVGQRLLDEWNTLAEKPSIGSNSNNSGRKKPSASGSARKPGTRRSVTTST